ncbi:MAG: methyltransferase domain-containing protein [Candidatus Delongbacteria bacterium]|jgi:ubiquinone/menaquinone biosynthesis C-methylase UbiE|nr:methyltransferase domain-containing protein [Candidatus Delongbacteria bacterium]
MAKKIKTHYIGHDGAYRYKKSYGETGWGEGAKEYENLLQEAFTKEYVPKNGKFLELGCGAGETTLWFAEKGYESFGVDISPIAIEWAKEKATEQNLKADFRTGNVIDLKDYEDNYFDFILDAHCLHCIIGEDREQFLKNVFRVLKKGGFFLSDSMCGEIRDDEWKKIYDPESRCLFTKDVAQRYIGLPDDIVDEIRSAGFTILHSSVTIGEGLDNDMLLVHAIKK